MSVMDFGTKKLRVGLVGGGRAALKFFNLLRHSATADVAYVVDPKADAPAMVVAREDKLPVYTELDVAIRSNHADMIFDVTGRKGMYEEIAALTQGSSTPILAGDIARFLVQIIEEDRRRVELEVVADVTEMKQEISDSIKGSAGIVGRINSVMSSMQMLALNASIEAARAGVHGKGFAVVADSMGKSVDTVRKLTQEIEAMNVKTRQVAQNIDRVLERLK